MNVKSQKVLAVFFIILLLSITPVNSQQGGIANQQAPAWEVNEWFNLPPGKKILDVSDYKGKVIYLMAFQKW